MSVKKELEPTEPFFMQECPLCHAKQPMMIRGLYVEGDKSMLYPDMGYSFCNCRDIFYTKWENVTRGTDSLNSQQYPIERLRELFDSVDSKYQFTITMRDPYFINWLAPHNYTGFNPRCNYILWDMESFANLCLEIGFEVRLMKRDMDVESKTPECYHIHLKKP